MIVRVSIDNEGNVGVLPLGSVCICGCPLDNHYTETTISFQPNVPPSIDLNLGYCYVMKHNCMEYKAAYGDDV